MIGGLSEAHRIGSLARDRRPIYELAGLSVRLEHPLTITGPVDVNKSRHFIGPFDALLNHRVRTVNVLMPPRGGKSLISDLWLWYLIKHNPAPFMWVFQDEKLAKFHKEERVKRILRSDPVLRPWVPAPYEGELKNVLGMSVIIDGPALGNLTGRGIQNLSLDEVWQWRQGMMEEAIARQDDFRRLQNEKLLVISQGGVVDEDWHRHFKKGIIHEWNVQCQGCGKYFQPVFSGKRSDATRWGMVWDQKKDEQGFWDIPKCVPTTRYLCFHCGHAHVDTPMLKDRWNVTGKYVAEETDKSDTALSFHASGIISTSHQLMVDRFLSSRNQIKNGNTTSTIQFFQKQMAEFANDQTVRFNSPDFSTSKEITSDWSDEDGRLMTIDSQQEGAFWVLIRQWSARKRQCRRLFYGKAQGESELVAIQEKYKVPSNWVLGDSGFRAKGPGGMYAMAIRHGWIALKGVGTVYGNANREGFFHTIEFRKGEHIRVLRSYSEWAPGDPETGVTERANLFKFASDQIADVVDGLIDSGFWVEPENDGSREEKEYRTQMSAEFKKTREDKFSGREISKRVCPSRNNHAYDCSKMQVVGAIMMDWILDPLDNRTVSEKSEEKQAA